MPCAFFILSHTRMHDQRDLVSFFAPSESWNFCEMAMTDLNQLRAGGSNASTEHWVGEQEREQSIPQAALANGTGKASWRPNALFHEVLKFRRRPRLR